MSLATTGAGRSKGQNAATPFVGAYDAIANLVHVYEPARCTLSAYTGGALLRLRRDSDDAESDFSHGSAFDPELDVASITAWLAGSAGYIVSVYDQKTGDAITQAAEAGQPLYVASIQNGHAGLRLNGTSHFLMGAFTIGGALSQPFSAYALAKLDAVAVDSGHRHLIDGDDVANRMLLRQSLVAGADRWFMYAGDNLTGGASDADLNLWAALFNGISSQFWLNTISEASGSAGAQNPDGICVGGRFTGTDLWDGDIMMIAIADPSHSDAQRLTMQTAINSYWGIF